MTAALVERPVAVDPVRSRWLSPRFVVLGMVACVMLVDQSLKFWGWRHVGGARINNGGDVLVSATVGAWFADPVRGGVLDIVDCVVLVGAIALLIRGKHPWSVLLTGTCVAAGWSSNLLDRLGLHFVTAPASVRGAVDYIPILGRHYNVADLFIIAGTPLLVLAVVCSRHRCRVAFSGFLPRPLASRACLAFAAVGTVALLFAVGYGIHADGWLTAPMPS